MSAWPAGRCLAPGLDLRATLPDGQPLAVSLRSRAKAWRDGEVEAYLSLPQSDWRTGCRPPAGPVAS
jgi:hypothetical protein